MALRRQISGPAEKPETVAEHLKRVLRPTADAWVTLGKVGWNWVKEEEGSRGEKNIVLPYANR